MIEGIIGMFDFIFLGIPRLLSEKNGRLKLIALFIVVMLGLVLLKDSIQERKRMEAEKKAQQESIILELVRKEIENYLKEN